MLVGTHPHTNPFGTCRSPPPNITPHGSVDLANFVPHCSFAITIPLSNINNFPIAIVFLPPLAFATECALHVYILQPQSLGSSQLLSDLPIGDVM